jgi:hypothetical protein
MRMRRFCNKLQNQKIGRADNLNWKLDMKFSADNAFLELPTSGTLKVKIFESQKI